MNTIDMAYLKEDGSLDIERIKNLPIEEYMDVIGDLTQEQYDYYLSKIPINEGKGEGTKIVNVHPSYDDGVDIEKYLKNKRSELRKRNEEKGFK